MAYEKIEIQRPIESLIKVRRTTYRECENPVRWAYTKLLREHDKTKQFFPEIDPYAEVYKFRDNLYGIYTLSLDGMGDPWSFLIDGPDKALLIDTSFGLGDLKGLVEKLIGPEKPYYVANTHCHFDHAYGNFQFDKVYCHEYEVPALKERMNPHIWDYLFDENGNGIWAEFDRNDLVPFREYELIGVPDGYIFDLGGGYEVELIFLPGHSAGHCGFLDKHNRILFVGDDCCVGNVMAGGGGSEGQPYREYMTIEALAKEIEKILARRSEYDCLFPSHGLVDTGPVMLESLLETCMEVIKDPGCFDYVRESPHPGVKTRQYGRRIFESGYLLYSENGVYMDRKAEIG